MSFTSLKAALNSFLSDQPSVTDLVSDRIYSGHNPQTPTFPSLVYTILTSEPVHNTGGSAGVTVFPVQFDCCGRNSDVTDELRDQLRQLLDGRKDADFGGVELMWSHCTDEQDFSVAPQDGKGQWLFRSVARYDFKVRVDVPRPNNTFAFRASGSVELGGSASVSVG